MSLRKRFFDFVEDSPREHGMGTALREGVHAQFEDTAPRSHLGGVHAQFEESVFRFCGGLTPALGAWACTSYAGQAIRSIGEC